MIDAYEVYEDESAAFLKVDIDAYLDYVSELAGEKRRRSGSLPGSSVPAPATRADRRTRPAPKVELVLYMSPASEKSQRAVRAIEEVLRGYDRSQIRLTTCDLASRPEEGEADSIVFTPTLVKQGPGPRTSIIGNLEDRAILRELLDASGVDRRWDD